MKFFHFLRVLRLLRALRVPVRQNKSSLAPIRDEAADSRYHPGWAAPPGMVFSRRAMRLPSMRPLTVGRRSAYEAIFQRSAPGWTSARCMCGGLHPVAPARWTGCPRVLSPSLPD